MHVRRWCSLGLGLLGLSACGMDEVDFVPDYNEAWCSHVMTCSDRGVLNFDGITNQLDCEERNLIDVVAWGEGCTYRPAAAQQCLFDTQGLSCATGDGGLASRPGSCDAVYVSCTGPEPELEQSNSEPEEEEAPEDSGTE